MNGFTLIEMVCTTKII
ncbi:TPA: prepilin-type N-terminal cleavage/methylation domain-containing protein [Providencia stuartii]|nr:prepilin-type N-terminal cleavage/methylation domain-containing protein [Providencia stuartii]